jgi:hypothetical protein
MALGVNIVSEFNASGVNKAIRDFKKLKTGTDKLAFSMQTMDKAVTNGIKNFAKYGGIVAGVGGIIAKNLVDAAYESQKVMAQTEAIITATGGAAGKTAKQVQLMSEQLSLQVGVDDEVIQKSANLLLTFKQVQNVAGEGNKIFDRAMMSVLDLGNVFGSTDAAAKMLGKALSNPVKGVGALSRAGVNFSDEQKAQIKTLVQSGKTLDAQKIILAEVEAQVGGTAKATATGFDIMKVAIGNAQEELGYLLIPAFEALADFVTNSLLPIISEFSRIVGEEGLAGGLAYLGDKALDAIGSMSGWANVIYGIVAAVTALKVATIAFTIAEGLATIAVTAFGVAWNATGIGLIASAIALAVVALVALIIKFKAFREFLIKVWNVAVEVVQKAVNLILGYWEGWINKFIGTINIMIKAWNKIPFTKKISEIDKVNLALDITGAKIDTINNKATGTGKIINGWGSNMSPETIKLMQDTASRAGNRSGSSSNGGDSGGETAMDRLKKKLKKYADLVKTTSGYQSDLKKAIESTGAANDKLAEANKKLATAQQSLLEVTRGFGAGSKQALSAQEEYEQAQRDGVRAGFELEKSQQAVVDAESELAKARMRNNPQQIREAEIALAEAQMTVTEKQIALRDATDATAEAQRKLNGTISGFPEDSEEYRTALQELTDAQKEAKDAVNAVADAKQRELEITNQLIAANKQLAKLKVTKKQAKQIAQSMKSQGITITPEMWQTLGITPFAKGGIVTSPVNALIGEAGAEAVIPLDRMGEFGMGKGGDTYITVEVTSADPNAVVDALRRYQRQNGALPLRVAG